VGQAVRDGEPGLLEWMTRALVDWRGTVERVAARVSDGSVHEGTGPEAALEVLELGVQHVAIELSGPGARAFFAGEHGCHVWSSALRDSEIVRVEPTAAGCVPSDLVAELLDARGRFEAALERSDAELPDNPLSLLPAVRRFSFDAPARPSERVPIDVEDYRLGFGRTLRAPSPEPLLPLLWLLSAARDEGGTS